MKQFQERRLQLKSALAAPGTLLLPGCFDGVSAKLVELAGFSAAYIGSYATSASRRGSPDVGLISMTEMVDHARSIVDAIKIPVIADAENGFNNAANIWQTVQAFEHAGVSAIHIEDHEFGKHTTVRPELLPADKMVEKIRAAIDAREDPNFMIIARSDAAWAWNDPDEAIRRLSLYAEAGADLVFPAGIHVQDLAPRSQALKLPIVMTNKPGATLATESAAGAKAVIYYGTTLFAAYQAVRATLIELKETGDANAIQNPAEDQAEFEEFIGYPAFVERARRYGLSD